MVSDPNSIRTSSALSTNSISNLDPDVRDTLYQFDSILTALEVDSSKDLTPSPVPLPASTHTTSHLSIAIPTATSLASLSVTANPNASLITSSEEVLSSNRSEEEHPEHINGLPVEENQHPVQKVKVPPHSPSELTLLRKEAKVKQLREQFIAPLMSPGPLSVSSPPPELQSMDIDGVLKSQSRIIPNHNDSVTSPIVKDLAVLQQKNLTTDRITQLNKGVDETPEKTPSTYKPSTLRRKVMSPFLDNERESNEEMEDTILSRSVSPDGSGYVHGVREITSENRQQEEILSASSFHDVQDNLKDIFLLPTIPVQCDEEVGVLSGEDVSLEDTAASVKHIKFKMDHDPLNPLSSENLTREEGVFHKMVSTVLAEEDTKNLNQYPIPALQDNQNWQDSTLETPSAPEVERHLQRTNRDTVSQHRPLDSTPSTLSCSSYIVDGEKDDDHLVAIVLPFRPAGSKKKSRGKPRSSRSVRENGVSSSQHQQPTQPTHDHSLPHHYDRPTENKSAYDHLPPLDAGEAATPEPKYSRSRTSSDVTVPRSRTFRHEDDFTTSEVHMA